MKILPDKFFRLALAITIAVAVVSLLISTRYVRQINRDSQQINRANEILYRSERILVFAIDIETGSRGYTLTGEEKFLEPLTRSKKMVFGEIEHFRSLYNSETQSKILDSLQSLVSKRLKVSDSTVAVFRESGLDEARKFVLLGEGKLITDAIREILLRVQQLEKTKLDQFNSDSNRARLMLERLNYFIVFFFIFVLLGLLASSRIKISTQKKTNLLLEKTVRQNADILNTVFDRISDAFVALDKDWKYTFMNQKAGQIFNRDPVEMIGKHIWTEFPEGRNQPFARAYEKAMNEQCYVFLEEYYPPYDLWFENHIYPSPDGLSIFFRDVTERKRVVENLRIAHQRITFHLSNSPIAIVEWDNGMFIRQWSGQAEKLFGWTKDEVIGKHFSEINLVNIEDSASVSIIVDELMNGTVEQNKSLNRNNTKTGSILYCEWFNSVLKDNDRKILSIMSLINDVTVKQTNEQEVKKVYSEMNAALNRTTDSIISLDNDWRYTFLNETALLTHPGSRERILGRSIWEVHPELSSTSIGEYFRKAMKNQKGVEFEDYYPPLSIWVNIRVFPSPSGLTIYYSDITNKKHAEETINKNRVFIESLLNASPDVVYIYDIEEGKNVYVNEGIQRNLGYTSSEIGEMNNLVLPTLMHPDDFRKYVEEIYPEYAKLKGSEMIFHEYRMKSKRGEWHWLYSKESVYLRDAAGKVKQIFGVSADITDRKRNEERIQEQAIQLQMLSNNLPDTMIYQVMRERNGNMKFTYLSKSVEKLTGVSVEEVLRKPEVLYNLILEEDRNIIRQAETNSFENMSEFNVEVRYSSMAGDTRWLNIRSVPRMVDQDLVVWDGINTDITLRKQADDEIFRTKELLERAENMASIGSWEYDFKSKKRSWSKQLYQLFGIQPNDNPPREEELLKRIDTEDQEAIKRIMVDLFNGSATVTRVIKTNPAYLPIRYFLGVWSIITDEKGKPYKLMGALQDITDSKIAEKEILFEKDLSDSIINSLPGIFYLFNRKGNFLRWNKNYEFVSGYNSNEIATMTPADFFNEEERPFVMEKINNVFATGEDQVEARFITKSNTGIPYFFTGRTIEYQNETCLLGVGIDISEKVQAQEDLRHHANQLQQLSAHLQKIREEERKHISREIHDELGQQLTAIKMEAMWIQKRLDDTDLVRDRLKNIIHLLDSSNHSIRKILTELRVGIIEHQSLDDALQWQANQFEVKSGIKIDFVSFGSFEKISDRIATCLFRVFQESLTNIIRYAKASKVKAEIRVESDLVLLSINDDGVGFKMTRITEVESFGILGMRERVSALGGVFSIESEIGRGTGITVRIPLRTM